MTILIISFVAGVLTVLAPCILPLLPVIIGGSVVGENSGKSSRIKAFIITISLGVSVMLFTLLLKVSTLFINIPPEVWSWVSGGIIIILGLLALFPALWDKIKFLSKANKESNKILAVGYKKNSIWGDIIMGASLGPVFSTCSPTYFFILATILPLDPFAGFIDLLVYTLGLCLALLVIAFVGQKLMAMLGIASNPYGWFKRTLGLLFIIIGIAIFFGQDKIFEAKLLDSGVFDITKVEQVLLQNVNTTSSTSTPVSISASVSTSTSTQTPASPTKPVSKFPRAPELVNPSGFINTGGKPITLAQYKGKSVVLIDVWTYSCINCQRTLPYVKAWYEKYHDKGLEIIGLHTPEFSFEKVQKNVEAAVLRDGIKYPVVLDNDYATWNAYGNQFWPRKYLINKDGYIIYDHIGEGNYDETEMAIRKALGLDASEGMAAPKDTIPLDETKVGSPETYFGAERNVYLGNGDPRRAGEQNLVLPQTPDSNTLYLGGTWDFRPEYAEGKSLDTTILFKYNSKNVYMVASAPVATDMEVWIDGVKVKTVSIKDEMLYTLIEGNDYGTHTLLLKVHNSGLKAFTFTFG